MAPRPPMALLASSSPSHRYFRSLSLLLARRLSTAVASARLPVEPATIRRLARARRFSDVETLLEPLKSSASPSEPLLAAVIASYSSAGMLDHALRTLADLPRLLGSPPSARSLNALLAPLNHLPRPLSRRIPDLLSELSRAHSIAPDHVSYGILVKSICRSGGGAHKALPVLKEMEEKKLPVSAIVYTTVLDSLYKEGRPEEAERLWKEMASKGVTLDLAAYNVRIMYRALHGKPEDVLDLIALMESEAGLMPDMITFNYLMASYCTHGRLKEAMAVYRGLEEKGCAPNSTTYKQLLAHLCKNEDFEAGLEVFDAGVKQGKVPDLGTVKLLVKGLMKVSKVRAAKRVVSGLKHKFPEDFVGKWKKLEKLVGLTTGDKGSEQQAAAA